MLTELSTRSASQEDAFKLSALSIQVWLHTYATSGISDAMAKYVIGEYSPQRIAELVSRQNCQVVVAEVNENAVGYAVVGFGRICPYCEDATTELMTLYVQEHFKRQSVGTTLLHRCESIAASQGTTKGIWLTVNSRNWEARSFYATKGFVDVGVTYFELDGKSHENRVLLLSQT
ncbi:GNAT family N-acetyltransferase [Phormidium tenue FACHB-886]|nr:GNAT family N-acetyltransferase [Phormidium tenue FACHB-886]